MLELNYNYMYICVIEQESIPKCLTECSCRSCPSRLERHRRVDNGWCPQVSMFEDYFWSPLYYSGS